MTSLNAATHSSTEVLLTWQQSTENNCRENKYNVKYQLISKDQCDVSQTDWANPNPSTVHFPIMTMIVRGLILPYSSYNLSVTARNNEGSGRPVYIVGTTGVESRYHKVKDGLTLEHAFWL